jgi:hypothetical protein
MFVRFFAQDLPNRSENNSLIGFSAVTSACTFATSNSKGNGYAVPGGPLTHKSTVTVLIRGPSRSYFRTAPSTLLETPPDFAPNSLAPRTLYSPMEIKHRRERSRIHLLLLEFLSQWPWSTHQFRNHRLHFGDRQVRGNTVLREGKLKQQRWRAFCGPWRRGQHQIATALSDPQMQHRAAGVGTCRRLGPSSSCRKLPAGEA